MWKTAYTSKGRLTRMAIPSHSHLNYRPHIMSAETGASILDAALACIGNRISAILLRPGEKDENHIASLHNEVVSTTQSSKQAASLLSELGLSLLPCGSLVFCHLAAAPLMYKSRSGLPSTVFRTLGTQAAMPRLMEAGCRKARSNHRAPRSLISQSGGTLEKERQ
jgi:hypothetical protein